MGSNSSSLDLEAISKLVGGLLGGSTGNIDIGKISQLVGGLIGGSGSLGDIDIGAIAGLVGGLIGGNAGGDFDLGAITDLISGFVGGNATGGFDVGGFTDLLSGLIANGSNGIDLGGLLGNLNLGSDLDLGGMIEGISSASNGFDLGSIAEGVGQLVGSGSSIELPDLGDLVQVWVRLIPILICLPSCRALKIQFRISAVAVLHPDLILVHSSIILIKILISIRLILGVNHNLIKKRASCAFF